MTKFTAIPVLALLCQGLAAPALAARSLADCAVIEDDALRLGCYDALANARAQEAGDDDVPDAPELPETGDAREVATRESIAPADLAGKREEREELAIVEAEGAGRKELLAGERLRQERAIANNAFVITPHRRNYLLPITYNRRPNETFWDEEYPDEPIQNEEAKFQISLKALIWEDVLGEGRSVWAAYTQENWWQLYNESSPFRETNYQPEVFFTFENDWQALGFTNTLLTLGLNHQSNGQGGDLSRSWNRIIGEAVLERRRMTLSARAWYRIPDDEDDDDNPDILAYYGYGDLTGVWKYHQHEFSVMLRNNLRSDNKGAVQLEWTFPISPRFKGYFQYYYGYGESLIDYDHVTNRIGFGISLTDLL